MLLQFNFTLTVKTNWRLIQQGLGETGEFRYVSLEIVPPLCHADIWSFSSAWLQF